MLILGTMEVINFSPRRAVRARRLLRPDRSGPTSGGGAPSLLAPPRRGPGRAGPRAGGAAHLRPGPPVRPPVHLRGGPGPRGGHPHRVGPPRLHDLRAGASWPAPFQLGFLFYSKYRLLVAVLAIVLLACVWWFLERTPYGAIIKAGRPRRRDGPGPRHRPPADAEPGLRARHGDGGRGGRHRRADVEPQADHRGRGGDAGLHRRGHRRHRLVLGCGGRGRSSWAWRAG